jgi:hypothetical protein
VSSTKSAAFVCGIGAKPKRKSCEHWRRIRKALLSHALLACFLVTASTLGAEPSGNDLRRRFLAEAPARWADYLEQSKLLQGQEVRDFSLLATDKATGQPDKCTDITTVTWKTNGQDMSYRFVQDRSENGKVVSKRNKFYCLNSRYGFILDAAPPNDNFSWILFRLSQNDERDQFKQQHFANAGPSVAGLLVRLWNMPLKELIEMPQFQLTTFQTMKSENDELVEVVFEFKYKENEEEQLRRDAKRSYKAGRLLLDPNRFWCVRESEVYWKFAGTPGVTRTRCVEMGTARNSLPWPKHIVVEGEDGDVKTRQEIKCELDVPSPLPGAEEFRMSHYGLPEPAGVTWPKPTPWYLWFIAMGVVCLGLGIFFRRRVQWRKKNAVDE